MQEGKSYFRTPALSPDGRLLAFVYASDIWLVDSTGGNAERLTVHPAPNLHPRFAPDGSHMAFTSMRTGSGDVYMLPLGSGEVQRLTYHGRFCSVQDWSIDGRSVYFTCDREQQDQALYRVAVEGGTPVLLYAEPYEHLAHAMVSPDGDSILFNVVHNRWWRRGPNPFAPCDIWQGSAVPVAGEASATLRKLAGEATHNPYIGLNRWPLWTPDGTGIYFVSDREGQENIWYQSLESGELRQVTHFSTGRLCWPAIARQAGRIVFEHEWQIWQLDPASGETAPIPIQVRADTKQTPVYVEGWSRGFSELALSPDGKKVAFVARGEIFADFAEKETDKEQRQGPSFRVTRTDAREGQISWTPDSRSLIYISDRHDEPEVYRYDFLTNTETRLTNDPAPKWLPRCSPDGKWIAYIRDTHAVYLLNVQSGETHRFAEGSFVRVGDLAWSPDSQWLAYLSHDASFFSNIYVQHISETSAHQITFLSNITGENLLWSPNGRFLVFTSGQYRMEDQIVRVDLRPPDLLFREAEFEKLFVEKSDNKEQKAEDEKQQKKPEPEQQPDEQPADAPHGDEEQAEGEQPQGEQPQGEEPEATEESKDTASTSSETKVEIIFEGIERRLRFLSPVQMNADAQDISPDSRDLLLRAVVAGKVNLWSLPLDEPRQDQPPRQLTANSNGKHAIQFAPNGKLFYYLDDGQITIRKFPSGSDATTVYVRGDVTVDFNQEKYQVFGEAWRLLRDTFYDASFGGRVWQALREQFAPLVAGAQTPGDLTAVLNLMVGELGASHTGAYWYSRWMGNDGYTGLLFDPLEQSQRGLLRVAALVPDSPVAMLAEPPRVGEYLIAVDGEAITPQTNLDHLLQRTIEQRVVLRLAATPEGEAARDLAIRPIDAEDYAYLRYRAWVGTNKAYVHRMSEGRLGYVHVEEMSYGAYQQFLIDLDAETHHKAGVILDIRYNSGGHIATFILDVLTRRNVLISGFRGHLQTDPYHFSGNRTLKKPTVLVTNESSASNAEIFTEIYRRLGLGKVVGKPTAGQVIGTINWWLLNGSYFRLPIYSYSTLEGENLEGTGRKVDIDVAQPLGEWAAGRDHQLDAAIASLLETLESAGSSSTE
jgi:Tol biopolymer transport system component/C-terminal processing protease CtpA/Prc